MDSRSGRELGTGAFYASIGLIASFGVLGLNSIAVARIEGPDAVGLVALSTQVVLITAFLAGVGLRTSVTYRVGSGLWSGRSAVQGVLNASLALGVSGGLLMLAVFPLVRDSALDGFSVPMIAALAAALPLTLVWWIMPAIPLALERFQLYSLLTFSAPAAVLIFCPTGAAIAGSDGVVIGFAAGFGAGGIVTGVWALRYARSAAAAVGPISGLRAAGGFGLRAWVNDLFQFVNVRPDLFILSAYVGIQDAGEYSVTISITSLVWILSQPFASVVLPRAAGLEAADDSRSDAAARDTEAEAVRHSIAVSLLASLAVIPALALAPLVWGEGFDRTLELGLILLPGVFALGVARVMVAGFTARGAADRALIVGVVAFPASIAAFLLVIPEHGAGGAALTACLSYLVATAISAYFFFESSGIRPRDALVPRRSDLDAYRRLAGSLRRDLSAALRR